HREFAIMDGVKPALKGPPPGFSPFVPRAARTEDAAAAARRLTREERLFSRDLSWLQFNERVLSEAADPTVPALERLRFCTIVSSNLDEFFMVRVAEVAAIARRYPRSRFADGLTAAQTLAQIRERVLQQKARQAVVLAGVIEALRADGIQILADFPDESRDAQIEERLPRLYIAMRRSSEPLPVLRSNRIHVFVRFPGEYAVLSIESREARLIELPATPGAAGYVLAERWLCARAARLFPGREVIEAFPFKIIRGADQRYRPDDDDTLEEQIVEAVERRKRAAKAVRLEVDAPGYSEGALFLATALGLDSAGLYRFDLPLDLRTIATLYHMKGKDHLRYPPIEPLVPPIFGKTRGLFETVRHMDVLLHHPYDSFDIVVRFLEAAADDPQVRSVYHTIYRTTRESPILSALQRAAKKGKKTTAYVEIKARFDELNNVRWAGELRKAGVKVVRPLGTHKVHSKLTRVVRREEDGDVAYLHLGTGNYHHVTARQYTDLGLLTCDTELGREVDEYFSALRRGRKPWGFRELMVAPGNLYEGMLRLIRRETEIQKAGGRGRIMAKMNSLVDPDIIEALYEASRAGVSVELMVRGICCLIPGLKGLSENIRVTSVIDRFLEHSRIYYFHQGGEEKLYLSSADWMPRNFFTRYEIAFPVKDPHLRKYIRDVVLSAGLADNVKAWSLKPDGSYVKVQPGPEPMRSQMLFESLARKGYQDTALEHRV
ncbi:MAG TPA: polyphosphate kinase 1, partial [Elusimicrobiota bacterium]|nr:polyphosphate kinase 1 [Elusimicrobiota bacterium]